MADRKKNVRLNQDNNYDTSKKNTMRKIRIIYSDPYATESSSDDEEEKYEFKDESKGGKRNVKEIFLPGLQHDSYADTCPQHNSSKCKQKISISNQLCKDMEVGETSTSNEFIYKNKVGRSSSIYKGVRLRSSGKYGSEITNPIEGCRVWLGTFNTEIEAAAAYQKRSLEFERLQWLEKNKNSLSTNVNAISEECKDLFSNPISPSSVLEVSTPAILGNGLGYSIKEEGSVDANLEEEQSFLDFMDDIDAYPTLGDECGDLYALPPFDFEFATRDFSWIDKVLNLTSQ
ncbi:hypothetical protein ACB092_04G106300 [Castanea dentata]